MKTKAFTLIELLVVMVIAAVIMAVAVPSFIGMGRGAGMRTAVNNVRSTAALSRQWAITHREQITFIVSSTGMVYTTNNLIVLSTNDHACYYAVSTEGALIQSITELPIDVTLDTLSATNMPFRTDGGLGGWYYDNQKDAQIILKPKVGSGIPKTISISWLTGGINVQ